MGGGVSGWAWYSGVAVSRAGQASTTSAGHADLARGRKTHVILSKWLLCQTAAGKQSRSRQPKINRLQARILLVLGIQCAAANIAFIERHSNSWELWPNSTRPIASPKAMQRCHQKASETIRLVSQGAASCQRRCFASSRAPLQRIAVSDLLHQNAAAESVTVHGWVRSVRKQKRIAFAALGDGSSLESLQAVLKPDQAAEYVAATSMLYLNHFLINGSDCRMALQLNSKAHGKPQSAASRATNYRWQAYAS